MKSRMFWGITTLIILLIGVSVVLLMRNTDTEPITVYKVDGEPIADNAENKPPRPAKEGYKWEWHGDHWHEIQVAQTADDAPVQQVPVVDPAPVLQYKGPLTFHEELLKTNPVEALRKQTEERGHWSAEWIPPFPPDDTEAQEFARVQYLRKYYIQNYGEKLETPEYEKEAKAFDEARAIYDRMYPIIMSYPYGARQMDLMKLTWPSLSDTVSVSDSHGNIGGHPSEYFGDAKTRDLLKSLGMWDY